MRQPGSDIWGTDLDQEEEADVTRIRVFECDAARPICLVLVALADKCYTFCHMADDGWLNFDGLEVDWSQGLRGQRNKYLCSICECSIPVP